MTSVAGHLAPLLEPLRIGSRTLRNRIIVTAHATHNVDAEHLPNADDVAYFAEGGYRLDRLRAFDLFPMTHHVESVAVLDRAR